MLAFRPYVVQIVAEMSKSWHCLVTCLSHLPSCPAKKVSPRIPFTFILSSYLLPRLAVVTPQNGKGVSRIQAQAASVQITRDMLLRPLTLLRCALPRCSHGV